LETVEINTLVKNNMVRVPAAFNNRQVKILIIDWDEQKKQKAVPITRKINFKIDDSLEDVIPFADIIDTKQFVDKIRENQWQ